MVDHILPFDDATFPLIRDALFVLASKVCAAHAVWFHMQYQGLMCLHIQDIKLSSFQSEAVEEFEDEGDMMGAAVAAARNKLISQVELTFEQSMHAYCDS